MNYKWYIIPSNIKKEGVIRISRINYLYDITDDLMVEKYDSGKWLKMPFEEWEEWIELEEMREVARSIADKSIRLNNEKI